MEFNIEKEEFVNNDQKHQNQLSTSADLANLKSEPEDNSAMEIKAEIKEDFIEDHPIYVENQLSTSTDLADLKNGPEGNSAMTVKAEIKEDFIEDDPRYLDSQQSTFLDVEDLKNEADDYNSVMDKRKRLSGAAYRKKAPENIEVKKCLIKTIPKINSFFTTRSNDHDEAGGSSSANTETPLAEPPENVNAETTEDSPTATLTPPEEFFVSTDPADWTKDDRTIQYLIMNPPQQDLNIDFSCSAVREHSTGTKRSLRRNHFFRKMLNGEMKLRNWLLYSISKKSVFCIPCRLFRVQPTSFTTGFNNWKNAVIRLKQHEESKDHIANVLTFFNRGKLKNRIDCSITSTFRSEVQYWRNVLQRIVATIITLTTRGLSIQGDNSAIGSVQNGNFLGCSELIAEFDPFLREHLTKFGNIGQGNCNYLPNTICEELIVLMGRKVRRTIVGELKQEKYYSIIVDSTPDVSHVDQLAFLVRYVSGDGMPTERFIKYIPSEGHNSAALESTVISTLEECTIDLSDCRGQSYDNASNMSGKYSELQARIKNHNKLAEYVPCSGHSLNLVGSLAAEFCLSATSFFIFVQELYTFFSASTYRWKILTDNLKSPVVKSLSETRWSARADATKALYTGFSEIKDALFNICNDECQTAVVKHQALSIFVKMDTFEVALLAVIWQHILERVNLSNNYVQSPATDLGSVVKEYESLLNYFTSIRNNFAIYEEEAKKLCPDKTYKEIRKRKRKIQFDEGADDELNCSASDEMKIHTFYIIIDTLMRDLNRRLESYRLIYQRFRVITDLPKLNNEEINKEAENLIQIYKDDLDASFIHECILLKGQLDITIKSPIDISHYLKKSGLKDIFPNFDIALRIYLCIPVANVSAERSFSKIENNFRSSMTQERLNNLSILSIESDVTKAINYDDIIDDLAKEKSREKSL
ncbi:zinc finger MYM-type protein 1-like [Diabrotica virgifera virgifera]|uniref:TTF-type domain-containing protein n=1 Tax=Diabrotica virgifera virgifera TaxID=50390 RepID=A0ABM5KGS2_DIAVI|nr:zinc finger MYM-type protein 1-like [Diabrotica virgifera virgifera]XP_050509358.1 zinc finger MYM-type protein 1-like [Diabrotica virgifera virgifera]XP_050509359.1 zinc finger MYM-type protein 1-like [Diabrotica virgifera virgifera]